MYGHALFALGTMIHVEEDGKIFYGIKDEEQVTQQCKSCGEKWCHFPKSCIDDHTHCRKCGGDLEEIERETVSLGFYMHDDVADDEEGESSEEVGG